MSTATVKVDKARIDRLKEQLRSTPAEVDFERVRIMKEVYEEQLATSRSSVSLWR